MLKKLFAFAICFAITGLAATKPDFSGSYAIEQKKSNNPIPVSIRVVQTESAVEVTRVNKDTSETNTFPLDGSEGDYVTGAGVRGKCRAQLKTDALVLESLVASRPDANGPSLRLNTREEWRLSVDKKTLTIKTEIKCPDMPPMVEAAMFPIHKEKYQRLDVR